MARTHTSYCRLATFLLSSGVACGCSNTTRTQFIQTEGGAGSGGVAGESSGGVAGESSGGVAGESSGGAAGSSGAVDAGGSGGIGSGGVAAVGGSGGAAGVAGVAGEAGMSGTAGAGGSAGSDAGHGETVVFDFYERLCEASWVAAPDLSSGATVVECNVPLAGASARRLAAAQLEGNVAASNVVRVTPPITAQGVISGTFSGISLVGVANPRFVTVIGCPVSGASCDFGWQLIVRFAGSTSNPPPVFDNGFEVLDGNAFAIDASLSAVAGAAVDVTFAVMANNGASVEDIAFWVHPRIVSGG